MIGEELELPYQRPPLSKELWFNDKNSQDTDKLMYKNWQGESSRYLLLLKIKLIYYF